MWLFKRLGNKTSDRLIALCIASILLLYMIFAFQAGDDPISVIVVALLWVICLVDYMIVSAEQRILDKVHTKITDNMIRIEALFHRLQKLEAQHGQPKPRDDDSQ